MPRVCYRERDFRAATLDVIRQANSQVRQYNPPPNPAKITDSRATSYIALHGNESWELDALEPRVLAALIEDEVLAARDPDVWADAYSREEKHRTDLEKAAGMWPEVTEFLAS